MKRTVLSFVVGLICMTAFGQQLNFDMSASDGKIYGYCEVVATQQLFSTKVSIRVDYGQQRGWLSSGDIITDENGETKKFNSVIDALNWMSIHGWETFLTYAIGDTKTGYVYHFLLRKRVDAPKTDIDIVDSADIPQTDDAFVKLQTYPLEQYSPEVRKSLVDEVIGELDRLTKDGLMPETMKRVYFGINAVLSYEKKYQLTNRQYDSFEEIKSRVNAPKE